ncbi:hypothetical protein LTR28_007374 [Elasticomyces elasticus]|nr:hypothetical protein LTR28_007374 [Elasticomyces elasticus]
MDALTDKFNAQSETIDEWRAKVVELLLKPLVDGDEDATGDEYEDSTKQQDELYAQLQQISDTVAPYKGTPDGSLNVWALGDAITKRENHKRRAADYKREREYLLTLHKKDEIEVDCAICRDTIERGILTGCGHHFCKPCLDSWYGQSRSCPTCRRYLDRRKFQDITCKVQVVAPEEDSTATPPSPNSTPKAAATSLPSNYKEISTSTLDEIKSIDLHESFGSKIDTLARHVLWLRRWDPGSKSIMFSQFRDFLDVLGTAFARFGISFARLGRPSAIENFKHKSSIECLLIDAKANAAGVTLTNATHVFLCEPLIHSTIERQAIARVHRIGQQRVTQVYKYIIKDTVEEVIESISRNTEAEEAQQELPVSTMLVHGKGGGELVAAQDLWDCLFSNVRQAADSSAAAEAVVDRHLRVEAAEERRSVAGHAE